LTRLIRDLSRRKRKITAAARAQGVKVSRPRKAWDPFVGALPLPAGGLGRRSTETKF
jgi:hypothetical protein